MKDLAKELWDRRTDFLSIGWSRKFDGGNQKASNESRSSFRRPSMVLRAAPWDNPGLLSILVPDCNQLSACVFVVDAEAAAKARQLGVGGRFRDTLCAKKDARFGPQLGSKAE